MPTQTARIQNSASVFQGALSLRAGAGGAAGALLALRTGVSRGVFTNEAGLGSSAFAYGEVRDKTPVELGCMGIFQVFLDTLVMCTVTGLCLLCCRSSGLEGAEWTFFAYERALGPAGGAAVSLCTALFAVATVSAWCCYGREGLLFLTRGRGKRVYAVVAAVAAGAGCLLPLDAVFRFGDAMNGLMAVPNVTALFCCAGEVRSRSAAGKRTSLFHENNWIFPRRYVTITRESKIPSRGSGSSRPICRDLTQRHIP